MANFNFNKVILGGRLTSDPELKQTQSGLAVTSFNVAVNRPPAKDKEPQTDFITCVAWRNTAEHICKYFKKGSNICVTGSIQTRKYEDKDGNKRTATELVVSESYFVDSRSESGAADTAATAPTSATTAADDAPIEIGDDELPF